MVNRPAEQMTPMMKQYFEIKSRYSDKDTILFFRLGDFYEMFFDDAEVASGILDIALTSRNKNDDNPVPLCGVPFHSADGYISKLLANGKKIAICEQIEDPSEAKGIVRRDVIRVITPGTVIEPNNLIADRPSYLAAIDHKNGQWGFAVIDVSTGRFMVALLSDLKDLHDEISRLEPSEIIIGRSLDDSGLFNKNERLLNGTTVTILDDPAFDASMLEGILPDGERAKLPDILQSAGGAICHYVKYAAKEVLKHISGIELYKPSTSMIIDETTKRNLELTKTMIDGSQHGSLFWLINETTTPMGARILREWLLHPLTDADRIKNRLAAVSVFFNYIMLSEDIRKLLKQISDIERIAGRVAMESANARDLISLKNSLEAVPDISKIIGDRTGLLCEVVKSLETESMKQEAASLIESTIVDEPPLSLRDGGLIKEGVSTELDELRKISGEGKGFIARLEDEERKKTGISTLKVRYNRVFGYYIDVTNTHKNKVPETYIRKQTLANSERYITPELKTFEEKVLGADERIKALEYDIFSTLRHDLGKYVDGIKSIAQNIAIIDSLLSLGDVARKNRYVEPEIIDGTEIEIKEGRHPIIEKINTRERFVPNDLCLNNTGDRLLIITGPNMAGKSTIMRQAAIIVLMAQMGSFVPAKSARIGIVDRIFTRVGASDNIMRGQSTFMVEMQEAANILGEATNRSLIIIDEIGRGTSTFDGLAIAWAVAEFIHDKVGAKTLFATHYHELTDLELTKKGVKNFNVAVKEWNEKVIFLHKMVPGGVNHSYGIQVAALAGLPKDVVERAREILSNLETGELDEVGMPKLAYSKSERSKSKRDQLHLFTTADDHPVMKILRETETDVLTPIEALNLVHKLKEEAKT